MCLSIAVPHPLRFSALVLCHATIASSRNQAPNNAIRNTKCRRYLKRSNPAMSSIAFDSCTHHGLLSQDLTGTSGSDSYYACGFLSNYTRAATCCAPETVHEFSDPCYSWCDLPASMNQQIDTDRDLSMLDHMQSCLNETGESIGPLWCRMTQPHVITLSSRA